MCGRFTVIPGGEEIAARFSARLSPGLSWRARYNITPSQHAPVVLTDPETGEMVLAAHRWGLMPHWAKPELASKLSNARADGVEKKPAFRSAFRSKRCVVPASGFYEWQAQETGPKVPYWMSAAVAGELLRMAGLWEEWWPDEGAEPVRTFAIITTEPNRFMAPVHNRMPVLLDEDGSHAWLDPETPTAALLELLVPAPEDRLRRHAVSTLVNNPRNDIPQLVDPLD